MSKTLVKNRRATHDYEIIDEIEAGLALLGTEVKSVRAGQMSLQGAFVTIKDDEAWLTNANIPPWQVANSPADYDETRPRKVLIKKSQLKALIGAKQAQGLTILPLSVYSKGPRIKLKIALARGKKKFDKKESKKSHDIKRDVERLLRGKE